MAKHIITQQGRIISLIMDSIVFNSNDLGEIIMGYPQWGTRGAKYT